MRPLLVLVAIVSLLITGCGTAAHPTAADVLQKMKAAGAPIAETVVVTADSDTHKLLGRPNQYITKADFRDGRMPKGDGNDWFEHGGTVETFAASSDLASRKTYMEAMNKAMPIAAEYVYADGLVLLRLSHVLTPDQAAAYHTALLAALR
jgi:hypothetical protein